MPTSCQSHHQRWVGSYTDSAGVTWNRYRCDNCGNEYEERA
jgi:hypothetical protein